MSVSVKGLPQVLSPAYNPSVWYFDSTNKALTGFRYLVKVYNASSTLLATYRFIPRPGDGYCVCDLTKILKNFVSYDKDIPPNDPVDQVPHSWFGYYVTVQEEYNTTYAYDDYLWYAGNITNLASNATFDTHTFSPGDIIFVTQSDGGALKPGISGLHTVIAPTVSGTSDLYTDIDFSVIGSGVAVPGTITFADNRKTVSGVLYTSTSAKNYIFNGAIPFELFPTYDMANYVMNTPGTNNQFLTSMPRGGFSISATQDVLLNFAPFFHNNSTIEIINSNGDVFYIDYYTTASTEAVIRANVGPLTPNPNVISGSLPIVKANTEWYTISIFDTHLASPPANQLSELLLFNIDRRCTLNDVEILFMDRMGSFNSFSFQLRNKITVDNIKTTYKSLAGDLGTGGDGNPAFSYSLNDRGETVFAVDMTKKMELNTNWMDDNASIYFQELITSPVTYIKIDQGAYLSCIVTTPTSEEKLVRNRKLVNYTVSVSFSNTSVINI